MATARLDTVIDSVAISDGGRVIWLDTDMEGVGVAQWVAPEADWDADADAEGEKLSLEVVD